MTDFYRKVKSATHAHITMPSANHTHITMNLKISRD